MSSIHVDLIEIAKVFLKLGTTAFGGPAAHVALMEEEVVRRRNWMSRDEFLDLWGATHLIPGPNSTELAIHVGHRVGGARGLLVAGVCFIAPAMLIVASLAAFYARYQTVPGVHAVFAAVIPVILAVIAQAIWGLGRTAIKGRRHAVFAVFALTLALAGIHELLVLALTAALMLVAARPWRRPPQSFSLLLALGIAVSTPLRAWARLQEATPPPADLFATFVKIGSVLFGSGYVLIAFLRTDLVERLGWITERELLDAVAVGQFTPGPVFTTATFIGYLIGGASGAVVATVGIFLPAFVFVAITAPFIPRLRASRTAAAALDGVNVASWALMVAVTWRLAAGVMTAPLPILVFVISLALLIRGRVNSMWLILGTGVLGLALRDFSL